MDDTNFVHRVNFHDGTYEEIEFYSYSVENGCYIFRNKERVVLFDIPMSSVKYHEFLEEVEEE